MAVHRKIKKYASVFQVERNQYRSQLTSVSRSNFAAAGLRCRSVTVKQMDGKRFQGVKALGKSGLCSRQLAVSHYKVVPQSAGRLHGANDVEP